MVFCKLQLVLRLELGLTLNLVLDFRLRCIFTALHGMQTRSCDENSVRPSVCPSSVKRVHCDKTEERYV